MAVSKFTGCTPFFGQHDVTSGVTRWHVVSKFLKDSLQAGFFALKHLS